MDSHTSNISEHLEAVGLNEQVGVNGDKNPVDKFLEVFNSFSTRKNYDNSLFDFFHSVYGDPGLSDAEQKRKWTRAKAAEYLKGEHDYEADVNAFLISLARFAPKSARVKLSATKMFLLENNIELSQRFWRRTNKHIKGSRALTIDRVPENSELRKLVSHMPIHGKALTLLLSSSGMRIGEALGLKLQDITVEGELLRIQIPGRLTKTGNSRVTFASRETKEAYEEWLKVRVKYIDGAVRKSHLYAKSASDDRAFPFVSVVAYRFWANALVKTGMAQKDPNTKRRLTHPHVCRKFFRTKLGSVIQSDVVEALMGHEEGLTAVYRKYTEKDLLRFYMEGEHALLLFGDMTGDATKLRQEMNTVYRENYELRATLEQMKQRLSQFEDRFSGIEKTVSEIRKTLD